MSKHSSKITLKIHQQIFQKKISKKISKNLWVYHRYGELKPLQKTKKSLDGEKIGKKDEKDEKLGKRTKKTPLISVPRSSARAQSGRRA